MYAVCRSPFLLRHRTRASYTDEGSHGSLGARVDRPTILFCSIFTMASRVHRCALCCGSNNGFRCCRFAYNMLLDAHRRPWDANMVLVRSVSFTMCGCLTLYWFAWVSSPAFTGGATVVSSTGDRVARGRVVDGGWEADFM